MKSKWAFLYGFIILAILVGGIQLAKSAEIWQVSGKINADGSKVTVTGGDVDEIKGWTTLEDVIEGYNLDKDAIYKEFDLPADLPVSTALKDIATLTDEALSPSIMRDYITNLQNQN